MADLKLKVCGLTRPEDVAFCHALGVEFTGFVLAKESPRHVSAAVVAGMPKGVSARVGVFTSDDAGVIAASMRQASLDYAQLHGGQSAAVCREIGPERVVKVFWPERQDAATLQDELYLFAPAAAYFLFDAGPGGGGSGRSFAWERLRALDIPRPWFLAGGIGPGTAFFAIAACSPFGLDVSSGVETAPGVKEQAKIRELVTVMKQHNKKERQCM